MSVESATPIELHLSLDAGESAKLVTLPELALAETRVETHPTHTPDYREQVLHHEAVTRRLLDKLQRLRP